VQGFRFFRAKSPVCSSLAVDEGTRGGPPPHTCPTHNTTLSTTPTATLDTALLRSRVGEMETDGRAAGGLGPAWSRTGRRGGYSHTWYELIQDWA
jgi:hypothetical protein